MVGLPNASTSFGLSTGDLKSAAINKKTNNEHLNQEKKYHKILGVYWTKPNASSEGNIQSLCSNHLG